MCRTWHQNARVENSRCDMNYIVLPEKHVDIMRLKPE